LENNYVANGTKFAPTSSNEKLIYKSETKNELVFSENNIVSTIDEFPPTKHGENLVNDNEPESESEDALFEDLYFFDSNRKYRYRPEILPSVSTYY